MAWRTLYLNRKPYVPASLSEIHAMLGSMILGVPTFIDKTLVFPIAISTASLTS
jgi:hypothetical protein